jgi:MoaA/NifB/PqqE/SkfB family radical SAM enzyme
VSLLSRGGRPGRLRVLVLTVADRCDQRCLHCDIWRPGERRAALTLPERLRVVEDAIDAGVETVFLTGGEPLLSPDLWPIARRVHAAGIKLVLATNGMRLAAHADEVARLFDEVYVSLDGGSPVSHDAARGTPQAFARLRDGLVALAGRAPRPRLVARSVLHARNLADFAATVAAARRLGFDHASFLAMDASSSAFGGAPAARRPLVPEAAQIAAFEGEVDRLEANGSLRGFVLETAEKLHSLAGHLRASAGLAPFVRPDCNVPRWSSVVDADGALRPCFFHDPVGDARQGVLAVRESPAYGEAVVRIEGENDTCARCVCPKRRAAGLLERLSA